MGNPIPPGCKAGHPGPQIGHWVLLPAQLGHEGVDHLVLADALGGHARAYHGGVREVAGSCGALVHRLQGPEQAMVAPEVMQHAPDEGLALEGGCADIHGLALSEQVQNEEAATRHGTQHSRHLGLGGLPSPAEAELYQYYLAQNVNLPNLKVDSTAPDAPFVMSGFQLDPAGPVAAMTPALGEAAPCVSVLSDGSQTGEDTLAGHGPR